MKINVFDTETTGLPLFREPSEDPRQPHLVEIASLLHDQDGVLIDSFEALVRPDGWVISAEVSAIHGITHERAMDEGISEVDALDGYLALAARAGLEVAHNWQFDRRIVRIALLRYRPDLVAIHEAREGFCTCETARPVLKLPPTPRMRAAGFGRQFKSPNLAETLKHYTGDDHSGAHRARADAEACARIFFCMRTPAAA